MTHHLNSVAARVEYIGLFPCQFLVGKTTAAFHPRHVVNSGSKTFTKPTSGKTCHPVQVKDTWTSLSKHSFCPVLSRFKFYDSFYPSCTVSPCYYAGAAAAMHSSPPPISLFPVVDLTSSASSSRVAAVAAVGTEETADSFCRLKNVAADFRFAFDRRRGGGGAPARKMKEAGSTD